MLNLKAFSKALTIGVLITANLVLQPALLADCCKYCGYGTQQYENTRPDSWGLFYCYVSVCAQQEASTTNCDIGTYSCTSPTNDQCTSFVYCES